jgi:hypothetical protein
MIRRADLAALLAVGMLSACAQEQFFEIEVRRCTDYPGGTAPLAEVYTLMVRQPDRDPQCYGGSCAAPSQEGCLEGLETREVAAGIDLTVQVGLYGRPDGSGIELFACGRRSHAATADALFDVTLSCTGLATMPMPCPTMPPPPSDGDCFGPGPATFAPGRAF